MSDYLKYDWPRHRAYIAEMMSDVQASDYMVITFTAITFLVLGVAV